MSDESVSTSSFIKMKLLTWFSGYTVVSRTDTPLAELVGSSKNATEWRLAKLATTEPRPQAAETSVTAPVCETTDPEDTLSAVADRAGVEYICPVSAEVYEEGPGNCPTCSAPLQVRDADSEPG
jgi:hypothetical protein